MDVNLSRRIGSTSSHVMLAHSFISLQQELFSEVGGWLTSIVNL